jgi:hypothetical protein
MWVGGGAALAPAMAPAMAMAVAMAAAGCAGSSSGGGLQVKMLAATSAPPANVGLHFSVGSKTGEPVLGLERANFRIFEDGKLVSETKGKRALLDPRMVEAQFTLVLVDLSGPVVESEDMPELVRAVGQFVERVGKIEQVAVSVFDGRDDLVPIIEFGATGGKEALEEMGKFRPKDRNGNLNGAVMRGVAELEKQMAAATASRKGGNLVLFTDRSDLAHKVSAAELDAALDKTPAEVYVIATGEKIKKEELGHIARTDAFYSEKSKDLTTGFTQLGKHIEATTAGHYLLSYCSPKRKGEHRLEIEVVTDTDHGKLTHRFNAAGFRKGCSPKHRPAFDDKGGEAAPGQGEGDGDGEAQPASGGGGKRSKEARSDSEE